MNMASALTTYKKAQANDVQFTDSPHELIRIVFRVLLENLTSLQVAVTADNLQWQKPFQKCSTALSILRDSLDFENGGEIAANLDQIYSYSLDQLSKIIKDDNEYELDAVIAIISSLVDAWGSISSIGKP